MIGWIILAALALFIAVLLVRTLRFKPQQIIAAETAPCAVDLETATEHLAQMVRIPTISNPNPKEFDESKFSEFRALLRTLYPSVFEHCVYEEFDHTELLFHWKGQSAAAPVVLMAHYDVVPVVPERWAHDPFCGEVIEGELWGRGTIDTKITLMGVLESAQTLIKQGFVPQNDLYFAFAGDEEVSGTGAQAAVERLRSRGIVPAMVVDEGGAIVSGIFPGVKDPIAVIGIGEKGLANVKLIAKSEGGHASHPPVHSAVGMMSRAVVNCENKPFKAELSEPIRRMFETVGAHAPFALRMVFANLWCFGGLITLASQKLGGELNAMMRTTMAFTMAEGSKQANILPNEATATVNLRLLNTTTLEDALEHLKSAIHDPAVEVELLQGMNASPYADMESAQFALLGEAVAETWRGCIVSPYLMIACSDSRHFSAICKNVFKFSAMELSSEQRGLIHNDDERIPVTEIA
ncbi:MAG: M20/M25/M40 family metallo-hydrolase, partial [Pygmaiobacter sp.]